MPRKKDPNRIPVPDNPTYEPLIDCLECNKDVRHKYVGFEKRSFECMEPRKISRVSAAQAEEKEVFSAFKYQCNSCGNVRVYGNEAPDPFTKLRNGRRIY